MKDSAESSAGVTQTTLDGEEIEIEWRECEVYPVCSKEAEFIVETLVNDGGGYVYKEIPACWGCASELTEPEQPEDAEKAQEIEFRDRIAGGEEA